VWQKLTNGAFEFFERELFPCFGLKIAEMAESAAQIAFGAKLHIQMSRIRRGLRQVGNSVHRIRASFSLLDRIEAPCKSIWKRLEQQMIKYSSP
jgi:hypothetical protein